MIREPARVQATTYEAQVERNNVVTPAGEKLYSRNCTCSPKRTKPIVLNSSRTTTIPIVINTQPNPRIILIKVPTHSNNSNNNKSKRTESIAPRTRLIRIPFLPGSVPTTASVKRALPTASSLVNFTTSGTASRIAKQAIPLTGTIYRAEQCSSSQYSQVNQVVKDQRVIGPPTPITAAVTQTVQVSRTHQTLASMAGIQLTGADMQSHQDMSGAMPTATVEEIDVPVFIDEYLQDIDTTSSTSNCSNKSEEIGQEICTGTDKFDFDFDINLFTEDLIEPKEMDMYNRDIDSIYSDNINSDLNTMDKFQLQQLGEEEEALDVGSMCNGIDITSNLGEEFDFCNMLTGSENPILANFSQSSQLSSSQTKYISEQPILADDSSMDNYYTSSQYSLGFGLSQMSCANEDSWTAVAVPEAPSTLCVGAKRSASAATLEPIMDSILPKRHALMLNINRSFNSNSEAINTPDIIEQVLNFDEQPNTSNNNISTTDMIFEELRSTEENTTFTTFPDFSAPSTPNSSYSISTSNSHSNPPTCQTGFAGFITAPVSPAFSTASTSQFSVTTSTNGSSKRKRGRPAKEHADGPDPNLISQMTEDEAKTYRDRIKNNEASRVSRRKTKQREEEEKCEEDALQRRNEELTAELQMVMQQQKRFTDYLAQNFHTKSTYVKPEPED